MIKSAADVARQAVDMVRPSILALMEAGALEGNNLHLVVLDPHSKPTDYDYSELDGEVVAYEESFGNPLSWAYDYKTIARSRARLAWQHGTSSRAVHALAPHLLSGDDTVHGPGGVNVSGVVVAVFSGPFSPFDEMIANWVADAYIALFHQIRLDSKPYGDFFNQVPVFNIDLDLP